MLTPTPGPTPAELRFAEVLAAMPGATQAELAKALSCSERTVRNRFASPAVRELIDAAGREGVRRATNRLGAAADMAARFLIAVVAGSRAASAIRVAAANSILQHGRELCAIQELAAGLERFEKTRMPPGGYS